MISTTAGKVYIIALLIIAGTITFSQVTKQSAIKTSQSDSYIVNIAGRQRMLSQKITKLSLLLVYASASEQNRQELIDASALWEKSHRALQSGDPDMNLFDLENTEDIKALFTQIRPHFEAIVESVSLLTSTNENRLDENEQALQALESILQNESSFLEVMDTITFQYDIQAREKIENISKLEYLLYGIALLLLLLEALAIFRPAIKKLKQFTQQLIQQERSLAEANVRKQYVDELEQKNRDLESFTYITSHDLQEPLKTIDGFSQLLKNHYASELDEKGLKMVHYINQSAQQSSAMIKDLLLYSQLGSKKQLEPVDCEELIQEIQDNFQYLIQESGSKINTFSLPVINGYRAELKVLFQNLISNGIKYRKENAAAIIDIHCKEIDQEFRFSISDNGIGIAQKHFEKIFLVFQKLNKSHDSGSTGIGLAMCKKVVLSHHGHIWLESEEGIGTTFYVTIPKHQSIKHDINRD